MLTRVAGSRSWQQFLLRREGSVVATGCTLHTCVFAGMLAGHSVDVILSLSTAGVGVPAALEDVCGELSVHNNTDMRFEACSDTRVCRGILCVQQVCIDSSCYLDRLLIRSTDLCARHCKHQRLGAAS